MLPHLSNVLLSRPTLTTTYYAGQRLSNLIFQERSGRSPDTVLARPLLVKAMHQQQGRIRAEVGIALTDAVGAVPPSQ